MNVNQARSLMGFNWQKNAYDERMSKMILQKFSLSEALSNLLAARQIPLDEIENFLDPKIKTALPNPFDLLDMEKAVRHVIEAIKDNKKITIFADYDVDGATSSSLLKRFFSQIDVEVGI
jgi:single-stranded-DNA-specific exonuclease